MDKLEVYIYGKKVGELTKTRGGARFKYTEDLPPNSPLLSTSLPVKAASYNEGLTGNWFTGILPEGARLTNLAQKLNVSEYDYFELLKIVGCECAGAVQILAADNSQNQKPILIPITKTELYKRLKNNNTISPPDGQPYRVSIGGFQDKILVVIKQDEFFVPDGGAISTHILKPELPDYKGMVESEAWGLYVASFAAKASKYRTIKFQDLPVLCVERYDRKKNNGDLKRIHQEDFCQAMGLPVFNKYANEIQEKGDDPTYKKAAEILDKYSADPILEKKELARQMVVNFCLGNYDAHAKNYAFLHDNEANISVAPMYDVVPIAEVEPKTKYLSLRINHKILPEVVTREDLLSEICHWGLQKEIAASVLDNTLDNLKIGIKKAETKYNNASKEHSQQALLRIRKLSTAKKG